MTTQIKSTKNCIENAFTLESSQEDEVSRGDSKCETKYGSSFLLSFASFTASLSLAGSGACIVWTSPVLPKLLSNNTDINPLDHPINSFEVSLLVGLFAFGSLVSPLICGKPLDVIGRKNTVILFSSMCVVSLIMTAFSSNVISILIAKLFMGISLGGVSIAVPIFLSEISSDHNRGKIGCFFGLFLPLGQLYSYILGPLFSVRIFTLICAIPSIVHLFFFIIFVYESPVYFLSKGYKNKAFESLKKYRSNVSPDELEKELNLLESSFQQEKQKNKVALINLITDQQSRSGFLIGMGMIFAQLGSGIGVILPFLGPLFQEAQTGISGDMTAILVGVLKVIIFFIVTQIVEKVGRKPLMFHSSVLCSVSLFLLGLYFFLKENDYSSYKTVLWLPIVSIFVYIFAYSVGLGPVPIATLGELFNNNVRSTGVSTILFLSRILGTIFIALYPIQLKYIGNSGSMWIFSISCALGALFFHFLMPETKGKSFHEIQELLRNKK